jgi:peptidyl-prolyl cis-trans isomerase SurA
MMFRTVARVVLPLAFAATVCFPGAGQTNNPAEASSPDQTTSPVQPNSPDQNGAPVSGAATIGSSTSLDSSSNDVASLYGTPVEQIVARVNDRVITNSDITRAQTQLAEESRQGNWTLEQYNHSEKNLLRDLIDQQLLLSKAKELGITGDTEVIKRLDDIRKQNHLSSLEDLEKAVEGSGTSYEDFKANIRNSIITQQVVRDEVGSKMQVSQADIEKYYNEHRDSFTQQESVHLNEILIPTDENATSSDLATADAKAKEVEAKLKAGGSFADLAKQYSEGPTAKQGGDLGEFKRGALAKVLEDQTFDLPVDGYTGPIRTRQGYIILQVTAHTLGGTPPMQQVEPQIEQSLYMAKIEPAVRQYLTRLRDEAYIDIRPGFTDSAASPNETKPTFTAYVPPQPKKKKKKSRFDKRVARYGRLSDRRKTTAAPAVASVAAPAAASETSTDTAAAAPAPETTASARVKEVRGKNRGAHKNKREKIRYGRAPETPISEQQVANSTASGDQAATPPTATAAALGSDVQPLGPDLEHTPTITQPKQQKRRFSDEARNKSEAKKAGKHQPKVKNVKQDNAKPTALTPTETANQKVESAPLGLAGDTTHKKKKKVVVKNGEKTRLSDQKKAAEKKGSNEGTPGAGTASPAPDSNSSAQPQ